MKSLDIARLQSAPVGPAVSEAEIAVARERGDRLLDELEHQASLAAQHYAAIERLTNERDAMRAELERFRIDVARVIAEAVADLNRAAVMAREGIR